MADSSSDAAFAAGAGEYVRANGTHVFVERTGSGPPLVLVPGLGAGNWLWAESVAALAERFTVVMPEPRGGGRSEKPDERYSIELFAMDLLSVVDRFGLGWVHLLGVSLGGFVAQYFAARWPERVRRLILVSTALGGREQVGPAGPVLARTVRPRGRTRRERLEDTYDLGFTMEFRTRERRKLDSITAWRLAHSQPEYAYYRQFLAGCAYEGDEWVDRIAAPTLICAGADDPIVPIENAAVLQSRIAGSRVRVFDGRHLFFMERSAAFNRAVLEFLLEDAGPDGGTGGTEHRRDAEPIG